MRSRATKVMRARENQNVRGEGKCEATEKVDFNIKNWPERRFVEYECWEEESVCEVGQYCIEAEQLKVNALLLVICCCVYCRAKNAEEERFW